ncbi:MAG: radical SAM protein [Sumerlaeia bacterium]
MADSAATTSPLEAPAHSPAVDDPREVNAVLSLLDSTYLDPQAHARPTHYDIATSVVCNIKCPFCPRQTFGAEVKSGLLKEEHFDPIVPHLEASLRTGLYGLGEPFLNKRFFDFLAAAKAQGTYCMTSSHGMSLTDEVIDKVLESGLDELCVSMDGANKRTFEFLRAGAHFETVLHNVGALLTRRRERGLTTPRVHIACAISKYNVWQLSAMVRLTKRLGADRIAFSNLVLDHPEHAHANIVGTKVFRWNLERAKRTAAKLGVDCVYFFQKPLPFREEPPPPVERGMRYGCPSAWRALIVERDGNMKPCCYLDKSLGNTAKAPLEEQWNGPAAQGLRKTFTNAKYLEACKGCGQFTGVSDERTRDILEEAAQQIAESAFSEETRGMLTEKVDYFRSLARERGVGVE